MYDELTRVDIEKMEEEIRYRQDVLGPQLLAEMSRTRAFGDLSENAEYKEAKREKRRNEGRVRYLMNMIRTAKVIEVRDRGEDTVSLFSWVTIYNEARRQEKKIQIVTTLRQDARLGFVSKESPLGRVLMGRRVGDRVKVEVSETLSYIVEIRAVEKGTDNEDLPISSY